MRFSKICEVSTKTLRYYAEIGLINPDEINPENGYRYYSIRQLKKMLFINRLKSYHFSLDEIITRSTGKSAREFANERLFKPIGMKEIPDYEMKSFGFEDLFGKNVKGWVKDPNSNSTGGWGLTLIPRDMARFGFLYLNRGIWDNNQIIPKTWIDESTAMNPNKYGYLWWLRKEDGVFAYLALGDGGNVICCIPENPTIFLRQ